MDGLRFDALTRALVTSRRGVLRALLGTGAAALTAAEMSVAAQDDEQDDPFYRAGLACDGGEPCGSLAPCEFGLCTPKACLIDGIPRDNLAPKPGNSCRFCAPTLESWTNWLGVVENGEPCESTDGDPCRNPSGICLGGECAREPTVDVECGPDKLCCDGDCCEPFEICVDYDCTPGCVIDGQKYRTGVGNPTSPYCQLCDASRDRTAWTILPDGDNELCEECCQGVCCDFSTACSAGACVPGCRIATTTLAYGRYADGEHNPDNPCQICSLSVSDSAWAQDDSQRCGPESDRFCCNGECCPPGQCCDDGLACSAAANGCVIDEMCYAPDKAHPDTEVCKACKPANSEDAWTNLPDDDPCGPGKTRVCCNGLCCPQDLCCDSETGFCGRCRCDDEAGGDDLRASQLTSCSVCCDGLCCGPDECCTGEEGCVPCGDACEIDGQFHAAGIFNADQPCQVCDPERDRNAWSVATDGAACGEGGAQVCCAGICCPDGECCSLEGICAACDCEIGGIGYPDGAIDPDNPCQICDSSHRADFWSPGPDDAACGDSLDQVCCKSVCCGPDECCEFGRCNPCGCTIDGVYYLAGERNPANECEECVPGAITYEWLPVINETPCGESGDRICCQGACCTDGECCNSGCRSCSCEIDGQDYQDGEQNPANECERCSTFSDPSAWTPEFDHSACGQNRDQVCCGGVCCAQGECCNDAGACERCRCTIDGQDYDDGTVNPANACEVCDHWTSETAWALADDGASCGPNFDQVCCAGSCCPAGECCHTSAEVCGPGPCRCTIGEVEYDDGAFNPENECEFCDSPLSASSWSPRPNRTFCSGGIEGFICCNGTCCDPDPENGTCGSEPCEPEGCSIGGVDYPAYASNPGNDCEECNPNESTTSWTPASTYSTCGPSGDEYCAGGVCCALGICPNSSENVCGDEYCSNVCAIGGVLYLGQDYNPGNDCEWCAPGASHTSWTVKSPNSYCNGSWDRICCFGTCCEPDHYCSTFHGNVCIHEDTPCC